MRAIEWEVLAAPRSPDPTPLHEPRPAEGQLEERGPAEVQTEEKPRDVGLDYGAAMRGILNDDQGGPLPPPGLRMAEALEDVRASLQRNLAGQKGGLLMTAWRVWSATSTGG